eukprot:4496393-Pyramimonas_sp.AAC.1
MDAKEVEQTIFKTLFGAKPRDGNPLPWPAAAAHQLSAEQTDLPRHSRLATMHSNRPNPAAPRLAAACFMEGTSA